MRLKTDIKLNHQINRTVVGEGSVKQNRTEKVSSVQLTQTKN